MKGSQKVFYKIHKVIIMSIFSFLLGCMITVNIIPINKTCKIDDTDREYNIMKNSQLKNPELIILIISSPKNLQKRNNIRETWLKLIDQKPNTNDGTVKFKMKHYFVIGSLNLKPDDILHLSSEQSVYSDILILPIHDSYENLTQKVLKSFVWLNEQINFGLGFKYVLKCDDDSFVRIDSLLHELAHLEILYLKSDVEDENSINNDGTSPFLRVNTQLSAKKSSKNFSLYWGYFHGNAKIKTSGKWKDNNWILCDNYLPYALGGGYVISQSLVSFLAKNVNHWRHYQSEDVSVGTWLAGVNNVRRIHDIRFDTEWTSRGCQNFYLIRHNISPADMRTMYENVVKNGNLCNVENLKRKHYLYDWLLPPSKCCKEI